MHQLACTLTFEAVHGSSCDAGINHPNQYFSDSQKIMQSKVNYVFIVLSKTKKNKRINFFTENSAKFGFSAVCLIDAYKHAVKKMLKLRFESLPKVPKTLICLFEALKRLKLYYALIQIILLQNQSAA